MKSKRRPVRPAVRIVKMVHKAYARAVYLDGALAGKARTDAEAETGMEKRGDKIRTVAVRYVGCAFS